MSKITKATIKKFIKENSENLYISNKSSFSGMTDCIENCSDSSFHKAEKTERNIEYTLGINGAWFVGSSRDYFESFENESYKGYEVYNCCGTFIIAIKK